MVKLAVMRQGREVDAVPFQPLRMLILTDDDRGFCGKVVPEMKRLLEHRAFLVDTHRVADGPVDIKSYRGMILGSPVYGAGIRGVGPTPALTAFVEALPELDGMGVAAFCVYPIRPGTTLPRMKGLILARGGSFVASWAFWLLQPDRGAHILPTECMVRIR